MRSGIALVGQSNTGKSTIIECLRLAFAKLYEQNIDKKLVYQKINPLGVQILQLYGYFDADTKNWSDGILPKIMREMSQSTENHIRKWIVFDGPVDPGNGFK